MLICCSTLIWHDHPFETAAREIASLGVGALELGYWAAAPNGDPMRYGDAEAIRRLLADLNLKAPIATLYCRDESDRLKRLEFAAEVGCQVCIINGMGTAQDEIASNVKLLLEEAEKLRVSIAYENHINSPVDTTSSMEALSAMVESELFGFIVAPHHLGALGESTADCIRRLRGRVLACYLWDIREGYDPWKKEGGDPAVPEWPLAGEGKQDFREVFVALRDMGFRGCLDLMCLGRGKSPLEEIRPAVGRAYRYCLDCLASVQGVIHAPSGHHKG
jgi:sugar phosphate isomerase/epimerase